MRAQVQAGEAFVTRLGLWREVGAGSSGISCVFVAMARASDAERVTLATATATTPTRIPVSGR